MPDDKLTTTIAALARGERPPCPRCGAEYSYTDSALGPGLDTGPHPNYHWRCGTNAFRGYVHEPSCKCLERQLAAQDAVVKQQAGEIERLKDERGMLRRAIAAAAQKGADFFDPEVMNAALGGGK